MLTVMVWFAFDIEAYPCMYSMGYVVGYACLYSQLCAPPPPSTKVKMIVVNIKCGPPLAELT